MKELNHILNVPHKFLRKEIAMWKEYNPPVQYSSFHDVIPSRNDD
jgi:hypothetical protein